MKIIVLVKHVPEPTASWRFADDLTLDRGSLEGRLSQLDEHAVEQAVRLSEVDDTTSITYLTMGPAPAADALRNALAMGGHDAVHICDDALHGCDAAATSAVLAAALQRIGFDLVLCGMASTDADMSVVPSMIAERLGVAQATNADAITIDGTTLQIRRDTGSATEEVVAELPAVVSVTDRSGEPRFATFRAIMAARRKPVQTWSLADLGIGMDEVGLAGAAVVVEAATPRPPRTAGTVIVDDGHAAIQLADFLVAGKFI